MTTKYLALLFLCSLLSACATDKAGLGPEPATTALPPEALSQARSMSAFALSRLKAGEGDLDGSLAQLKSAMEVDPSSAYLHTSAAQIYLQQNKPEEALAECETALRLNPSSKLQQIVERLRALRR